MIFPTHERQGSAGGRELATIARVPCSPAPLQPIVRAFPSIDDDVSNNDQKLASARRAIPIIFDSVRHPLRVHLVRETVSEKYICLRRENQPNGNSRFLPRLELQLNPVCQ